MGIVQFAVYQVHADEFDLYSISLGSFLHVQANHLKQAVNGIDEVREKSRSLAGKRAKDVVTRRQTGEEGYTSQIVLAACSILKRPQI